MQIKRFRLPALADAVTACGGSPCGFEQDTTLRRGDQPAGTLDGVDVDRDRIDSRAD